MVALDSENGGVYIFYTYLTGVRSGESSRNERIQLRYADL